MSSPFAAGGAASDPASLSRAPDLVRDTRLDTAFVGEHTVHLDDGLSASEGEVEVEGDGGDADQDAGEDGKGKGRTRAGMRRPKQPRYWAWERRLAHGGCGEVWLQRCIQGGKKGDGEKRAVKVIAVGARGKSSSGNDQHVDYMPELEAIAKFSQKRVRFRLLVDLLRIMHFLMLLSLVGRESSVASRWSRSLGYTFLYLASFHNSWSCRAFG